MLSLGFILNWSKSANTDTHQARLGVQKARQQLELSQEAHKSEAAARRAAAIRNQRAVVQQMEHEQREIRLGAGQYGVTAHERLFNASRFTWDKPSSAYYSVSSGQGGVG